MLLFHLVTFEFIASAFQNPYEGENELLQIFLFKRVLTNLQVNWHLDVLPVDAVVVFKLFHRQVPKSLQFLPLDVI